MRATDGASTLCHTDVHGDGVKLNNRCDFLRSPGRPLPLAPAQTLLGLGGAAVEHRQHAWANRSPLPNGLTLNAMRNTQRDDV